ncbi:beta-L-arabinofuranosidase domain-containing protein [Pedobacter sp. MW01-1-1]|uniref:beta-L-arabinofuranosidase domain-containing protein n=1 Tax=Pedobacter sp. MW01-1-1 TaxID=3383027 RepID=UPI003FEF760F
MKLNKVLLRSILLIGSLVGNLAVTKAQSGDQILDGIGETGLNARYVFDGDLKDWSRNNFHAKSQGTTFITDSRFGKVLSFSENSKSFVILPGAAMNDLESVSITGWIFLRSKQKNQYFFDFGKDGANHFYLKPNDTDGIEAFISSRSADTKPIAAAALPLNKWVFISVVADVSSKSFTLFVDGKTVAEHKGTSIDISEVFNVQSSGKNQLYIGKSISSENSSLNALVHDFRIYRIPLSAKQVFGIYRNAQRGAQDNNVNVGQREDNLPKFAAETPQLYTKYLLGVEDVQVKTSVGNLPRLPSYVLGTYSKGIKGPKVRVLWPLPTDNSSVLKPGTFTVTGRVAGTNFQPKATITVINAKKSTAPSLKLDTFALNQVSLHLDGHGHATKFIENRDKFINTLAKTDPNSFLYMFRDAFGQAQPEGAKPLGVWDSEDTKLRGHATGHYLTAIAQAYASTGYDKELQANFSKKIDYMVNTLYELSQLSGKAKSPNTSFISDPKQVPFGPGKTDFDSDLSASGIRTDYWNWGTGFISAYPPDQFIMLEKGAKYGGQKNQVWAPYYTLHKILAGLLDVYQATGNKKALSIASNMGNWVFERLNNIPQETLIKMWNTYIAGEFGGMNESMAKLYQITGNKNYLKTAQLFDNIKVFYGDSSHAHGLAKNVDLFRGLHANQHIPQIVGSIELYQASNNADYYSIADNFWHKMMDDYMYSIGGVAGARNPANAECFIAQPSTLYENGFSEGGQNETCATYNMLKLTSDLFLFDQRGELMDYYERGLYNHILASVAENSPANTYHVPLRAGSMKQFGNAHMDGFTCCNGTAIESSTKLQNSIYFKSKDKQALYVNLFVPSTLNWTERKISIEQITSFPNEDNTQLKIKGSGKFDLHVRVPAWATKGFFVKINGKEEKVQATPGTYLTISRLWKDGDIVDIKMPFQFHLDPVMDQQNIASLFYGPILLAAQEPEARKDWRKITLDPADISKSITGNPATLEFSIDNVIFKPFYNTYGRHSVYLDVTLK